METVLPKFSSLRRRKATFELSSWRLFAHLPNGIIRHIVSYTGATYKKRNGKYIGQIPKDDQRYAKLNTIPNRLVSYTPYSDHLNWSYATSYIELKKCYGCCYGSYNTYAIAITTYPDEGREIIGYYHIIYNDITGERRRYSHEIEGVIYNWTKKKN